jgi:hypothetical protein
LKDPIVKPAPSENKGLNIFKKMMLNPEDKNKSMHDKQIVAKDWLETYTHKLEYMFLKLGGEDEEMKMRQMKKMDKFEEGALEVRQNIKIIWEDIGKWDQNIKLYGFGSKERIMADVRLWDNVDHQFTKLDEMEK